MPEPPGPRLLSLIAAMDENRVIGRENGLPWRLPADLKRFKERTLGKPVIMGRRTFASIGRPLPGRRNIVLSRGSADRAPGVEVAASLDEAMALIDGVDEAFAIGGESVYRACLPRAGRIYLTLVEGSFEGDVVFPELPDGEWRVLEAERREPDDRNPYPMVFFVYERIKSARLGGE